MAGKNFFQRFAAETGYIPPNHEGQMVVVAIHRNIVQEYRLAGAPGTLQWKKDLLANGAQVATVSEERAKRILGKRFQELSYYGEEKEGV